MNIKVNPKNGHLSILDLNVAEAQVVYNALRDYSRNYYRSCTDETYNANHDALAEEIHDKFHQEYCSETRK